MNPVNIDPINAFRDNYIWSLHDNHQCIIVDPGDDQPVIDWLQEHSIQLKGILITHKHWDHINGVHSLQKKYNCPIISPFITSLDIDFIAKDMEKLDLKAICDLSFNLHTKIMNTPGHTEEHVCYLINDLYLFSGDTLFSAGCGRNFEGSHQDLFNSLEKLNLLPDDIKLFCGHEYTLNNLRFALKVDKNNLQLKEHYQNILSSNNKCTLPSTLGLERKINPFLRTHSKSIIAFTEEASGKKHQQQYQVFKTLRNLKDNF